MDALLGVAVWKRGGVVEPAGIVAKGEVPGSVAGKVYWYSGGRYVAEFMKASIPGFAPPRCEGGGRVCGRRVFAAGSIVPYGVGYAPARPCRKGLYVATLPIRTLAAVEAGAEWAVQAE